MKIASGSTLVFIGDSITEWGREQPLSDEVDGFLGNGYVHYIDTLIAAAHHGEGLRIFNAGIGGNTVRDLAARWRIHVLDLHPDWLSILIGINDVWRQFDHWVPPAQQISLDQYQRTLDGLIRAARPGLKGLVLMTPYYVESDRSIPMRAMMDRYGEAVRALAAEHSAVLVDTQAAIDRALRDVSPDDLAADRVHLNAVGHMILARAFLQAVDFSWD
jgi:lysophospholipase L1-like esterase